VCGRLFLVVAFAVVFVVVVVVVFAVFAKTCIYSCHYEDTSYTMALFLCMSQWCENDNHDLPQHVKRLLKWRDIIDGYKCGSIFIFSIPVTDTVPICTRHYMLFPFLLLYAAGF